MSLDKDKLRELIVNLIMAYKENIHLDVMSIDNPGMYAEIRGGWNTSLILTFEQYKIKRQLLSIILPDKNSSKSISYDYVDKHLVALSLTGISEGVSSDAFENNFLEFCKNISNPKTNKYIIGEPFTILLHRNEPTKIIDLELTNDPKLYLANKNSIMHECIRDEFNNPDRFTKEESQVAGFTEIQAIDQNTAKTIYDRICAESVGFLKLYYKTGEIYRGKETNRTLFQWIQSGEIGGPSSSKEKQFQRGLIDDIRYDKLLNYGLLWLNNWQSHSDTKKATKVKDALYWYKFAEEEVNLSQKLIFSLTILEGLLKDLDEKTELSAGIAERTAFLLAIQPETRIEIFNDLKKIYKLRSIIVHSGQVVNAANEYMVLKAHGYAEQVIKKSIKYLSTEKATYDGFINDLKLRKFGLLT